MIEHKIGDAVRLKMWTDGVPVEPHAYQQLRNTAALPFVHGWVAVMPDVHLGIGATVGSVIPTKGAIIPAAVGVDIGCGMVAVQTTLRSADLPDTLAPLRSAIEAAIPHGNGNRGNHVGLEVDRDLRGEAEALIRSMPDEVEAPHVADQLGTLGGGNHFVEVCLDESDSVWVMLHSGSRGTGNVIGRHYIAKARAMLEKRSLDFKVPDKDLAFFLEGEPEFEEYVSAVAWAQSYARINREAMMKRALGTLALHTREFWASKNAINCHHNYVEREPHFGESVWVTRKGAVRARAGDLGIIPGSMGTRSYIVRGLGNAESFQSCSHGAGRVMSRSAAKKAFTLDDHVAATAHVECRKDEGVIDETPAAYKDLEAVMRAQTDLVEIVHTLRQVLCVKG